MYVEWGTKIIYVFKTDMTLVQASPIEIYELDLNWLRLGLKDLEDDEDGMMFMDTHSHNAPVDVGGVTIARVIQIINGYTITFEDGQYAVNLIGANSNVGDNVNVNQVSVRSSNSAGLVTSAAIEYGEYQGGVTVDTVNGVSGTIYPIGTLRVPSSNIADSMIIMSSRGFSKMYVLGNITFSSGDDMIDRMIIGQSPLLSIITIEASSDMQGVEVAGATIQGTLDGDNHIKNCIVLDIDYIYGHIHNSALGGTITLDGNEDALLEECYSQNNVTVPVIDMGGSGQDLSIRGYKGTIQINNLTGDNKVDIMMDAGLVIIDSTVISGEINISGVCTVIDSSGGTATVDVSGVVNTIDLLKLTANKVTKSGDIITVYENDGLTVWRQFNLANGGRVQV